ncbi:MAG: LiaI-LiaF-like domain-containing protein [Anaerolineales bacterium]
MDHDVGNVNEKRRRRGIFVPLILIALGVIFLLNNMGLLREGVLETLLGLWPVLLIVLGINSLIRKRGIIGPALLIGLGGAFLLSNLGVLAVNPWLTVLRLWPVIFIAIGLEIIIGRRSIWLSLAGLLVVLGFLAAGVWYSESLLSRQTQGGLEISEPLGELDQARIILRPSIVSLNLNALVDSGNLIEGTFAVLKNEPFIREFQVKDGAATLTLKSHAKNVTFGIWNDYRLLWDIGLNTAVPLNLDIGLGIGESNLDLTGLAVSDLYLSMGVGETTIMLAEGEYRAKVDAGVGQTTIILPDQGDIRLDIDLGVGEVVIRIPESMAARIHTDRGITGLQVPIGYQKQGGVYASPGYATAENRTEIFVDLGIGNIAIRGK